MRGNTRPEVRETETPGPEEDPFVKKRKRGRPSKQHVKTVNRESESDHYELDLQDEDERKEKTVRSKRERSRKLKHIDIDLSEEEDTSSSKRIKERGERINHHNPGEREKQQIKVWNLSKNSDMKFYI